MKPVGETNSRESARPARPSQLIHAATAVTMAASATFAVAFMIGHAKLSSRFRYHSPPSRFTPKIDLSVGYAVRRILPS
jgi:hypothetical protein